MRLPARAVRRDLTERGRDEAPTSKGNSPAVATLFTFCPPGPDARTNRSSISRSCGASVPSIAVTDPPPLRVDRTPVARAATGARLFGSAQAGTTFSARGPFGPWPTVNDTVSPSRMESNGLLVHADWWKKYSVPSGVAMKPKPLSVMRLIVPVVGIVQIL